MTPYYEDGDVALFLGDCRDVMAQMEPESVSCVCCSPPFFALRKYTCEPSIWASQMPGCDDCEHDFAVEHVGKASHYKSRKRWQHLAEQAQETGQPIRDVIPTAWGHPEFSQGATCSLCGAWRGWLGLEPTVEMYVEHTIDWLRAVKRVLRKDGVVWLDIDDSRSGSWGNYGAREGKQRERTSKHWERAGATPQDFRPGMSYGPIPAKNLCLIPQRIAIAAQEADWIVRSEIIITSWMPESAKDRPTDACRKVLMLVRSPRYWYDGQAVRVEASGQDGTAADFARLTHDHVIPGQAVAQHRLDRVSTIDTALRNLGSVWTDIPPAAYPDAHFATFAVEEPERCILASCPAEICVKCGKARRRVVKKANVREHPQREGRKDRNKADFDGQDYAKRESGLGLTWENVTEGWTDCGCEEPDYQPGLVLDPFIGTGTTAIAARKLGRRCIGIDASEDYLQQAVTRLTVGDSGIRRLVEARKQGSEQMTLFHDSGPAGPEGGQR